MNPLVSSTSRKTDKFTHKKTKTMDILEECLIMCLQCCTQSFTVFCSLLYTKHMVLGDCTRLVDVCGKYYTVTAPIT
jgi:hypothetical protein